MKRFQGTPHGLKGQRLGIITRDKKPFLSRRKYIFLGDGSFGLGYAGHLSDLPAKGGFSLVPSVCDLSRENIDALQEGDIVRLDEDGTISVLWEKAEHCNCILMTEKCNCHCMMCPQPPKQDHKDLDRQNDRLLFLLSDSYSGPICITGGEPTLKKKQLLKTLKTINDKITNATLDILTNGQLFSDFSLAQTVAKYAPKQTTLCVSLHADTADLHNKITGTVDGFNKTVVGIRNLGRLGIPVEIRFVLTALNYGRTEDFARFVGQNFPFVVHVALMGLEMVGDAMTNADSVWVDPVNYAENLRLGVKELKRRGVPVSIYNVPLCLLDHRLWPHARQSISTWKNGYLSACDACHVREKCCGVFTTAGLHSPKIRAI